VITAVGLAAVVVLLWTIFYPEAGKVRQSFRRATPPAARATVAKAPAARNPSPGSVKGRGSEPVDAATALRRARHSAVAAQMHELSRAQADAVAAAGEADQDTALADFAESRRADVDAFLAARNELLAVPAGAEPNAPPLPESAAMRDRFASVRRALIEGGDSIDQAESVYLGKTPDP